MKKQIIKSVIAIIFVLLIASLLIVYSNSNFMVKREKLMELLEIKEAGTFNPIYVKYNSDLQGDGKYYEIKFEISKDDYNKNILEYKNNSLYKGLISYLPQDPKFLFIKDTVADDLYELAGSLYIERQQQDKLIDETIQLFEIKDLINIHPYDLSGGERQKCALAKLMLTDPAVFLLDEPTKGMDAAYKKKLGIILKLFKEKGKTVLITTHDIEFAAAYSDKCALLFNGIFACVGKPSQFFSGNHFYTTASARISPRIFNNTILFEDVVKRCKKAKCK